MFNILISRLPIYITVWDSNTHMPKLFSWEQMAENYFGHVPGQRGTRCVLRWHQPPQTNAWSIPVSILLIWYLFDVFCIILGQITGKSRQTLLCAITQMPKRCKGRKPPANIFKLRQIISTDHWQCLPGEQHRRFCLLFSLSLLVSDRNQAES